MKKLILIILFIGLILPNSVGYSQNSPSQACRGQFDWNPTSNMLVRKDNQTVTVYNLARNIIIFQHKFANLVLDVKLANDGQHLVVVESYIITRWNLKTRLKTTELNFAKYLTYEKNKEFTSFAISENGHYVYVSFPVNSDTRKAHIWDLQAGIWLYEGNRNLRDPVFAPVDNYLFELNHVVGSWGFATGLVYVWNWRTEYIWNWETQVENWQQLGSASYSSFYDIRFAPRMNRFAVRYSNTIMFWHIYSYKYVLLGYREFELTIPPSQTVNQIVWHPAGKNIATVITKDQSDYVKIWDSENGALLKVYPEQPRQIRDLYFDENYNVLALGCSDNAWIVWNTETLATINKVRIEADG